MPIHDWTRMHAGDFHHFHLNWICRISDELNSKLLPKPYMALMERSENHDEHTEGESAIYASKANRVAIRHGRGKVVAVIEIVSPGNKDSRNSFRSFVEKAADLLNQGIHLLIVDLFPPTPRDPLGIHKAIWDEFGDEPFTPPPGKPLTVASYIGGDLPTAYVDPVGVGDSLPSTPLFLTEDWYLDTPLESTYTQAIEEDLPIDLKEELLGFTATPPE